MIFRPLLVQLSANTEGRRILSTHPFHCAKTLRQEHALDLHSAPLTLHHQWNSEKEKGMVNINPFIVLTDIHGLVKTIHEPKATDPTLQGCVRRQESFLLSGCAHSDPHNTKSRTRIDLLSTSRGTSTPKTVKNLKPRRNVRKHCMPKCWDWSLRYRTCGSLCRHSGLRVVGFRGERLGLSAV